MMQRGIRNVSMDDIAKGLHISKKTIYVHFKDKGNLTLAIVANELESLENWMQENEKTAINCIEEFSRLANRMIDWLLDWHLSSLDDLRVSCHPAYELYVRFNEDKVKRIFNSNRERGINENCYHSNWNSELIVANALMMISNCRDIILEKRPDFSPFSIKQYFIAHFLFGLCRHANQKDTLRCLSSV